MCQVDECSPLSAEFDKLWSKELKKSSPSLIIVCLKLFKVTYISSIIMMVVGDAMIFLSPYAVTALNKYITTSQVKIYSSNIIILLSWIKNTQRANMD